MQHPTIHLTDFEVNNPDIILRSLRSLNSKGTSGQRTRSRARRQDLSKASSVFKDMFATASSKETGRDGLPVVRMQESQATLEGLLAFAHNEPDQMPDLDEMHSSDLLDLWEASHKYDMGMLQMVVALEMRYVACPGSQLRAHAGLTPGRGRVRRDRCLSGEASAELALRLLARPGDNGMTANTEAAIAHLVSLDPTTLPHNLLKECNSGSLATLVSSLVERICYCNRLPSKFARSSSKRQTSLEMRLRKPSRRRLTLRRKQRTLSRPRDR